MKQHQEEKKIISHGHKQSQDVTLQKHIFSDDPDQKQIYTDRKELDQTADF